VVVGSARWLVWGCMVAVFGGKWWLFGVSYWCEVEVGARCRLGAKCYACRNVFFFYEIGA